MGFSDRHPTLSNYIWLASFLQTQTNGLSSIGPHCPRYILTLPGPMRYDSFCSLACDFFQTPAPCGQRPCVCLSPFQPKLCSRNITELIDGWGSVGESRGLPDGADPWEQSHFPTSDAEICSGRKHGSRKRPGGSAQASWLSLSLIPFRKGYQDTEIAVIVGLGSEGRMKLGTENMVLRCLLFPSWVQVPHQYGDFASIWCQPQHNLI